MLEIIQLFTSNCFSDLKDMTVDDIIETFPRFESKLKRVFQKNLNVPDHRWEPKPDQCDYLVVLNQLLNDTQQTQMYLKLASEFAKESAEHITSSVSFTFTIKFVVI